MTHKIGWLNRPGTTGETWNPVTGCTKISKGCKNCYAERMSHRLKGRFGYPEDEPFKVTPHFDKFDAPLKWKKPRTVFVCSMGDLFHQDVGYNIHQALWDTMLFTPQHTYLLLTKRADNMLATLDSLVVEYGVLPNVWGLVSAENQEQADLRIPLLLQCQFAVRGVSIEPMLGAVDLKLIRGRPCSHPGCLSHVSHPCEKCGYQAGRLPLDWIIVGGETGPGARTMDPDWAREVRDQCKGAGVPYFFKQVSNKAPIPADLLVREWPEGQTE